MSGPGGGPPVPSVLGSLQASRSSLSLGVLTRKMGKCPSRSLANQSKVFSECWGSQPLARRGRGGSAGWGAVFPSPATNCPHSVTNDGKKGTSANSPTLRRLEAPLMRLWLAGTPPPTSFLKLKKKSSQQHLLPREARAHRPGGQQRPARPGGKKVQLPSYKYLCSALLGAGFLHERAPLKRKAARQICFEL